LRGSLKEENYELMASWGYIGRSFPKKEKEEKFGEYF
jgi:hypothetical protein